MTGLWLFAFACVVWVVYAYVGYPLLLWVLHRFSPRPLDSTAFHPPISVIIAVHNGGDVLRDKLESTLALDYMGPCEIIVTSDGSTDATDSIAEDFADRGVVLVRNATRSGKEAAQAAAIEGATGQIVVFTDVTAELSADALTNIVRPFSDSSVGSVSSEDLVETTSGGGGEGAYVRYEMAIRRLESETAMLVGLSGSFFAVRRSLCEPWAKDLASDFRIALETARRGFRAVAEPTATARFAAIGDPRAEWNRKVRTIRRGIAVILSHSDLLSPRYGRVALALWGHKVARFTVPFALIGLLVSSAILATTGAPLAWVLFLAQVFSYLIATLALVSGRMRSLWLPRLMGFFLLVNASMFVAWLHHLLGERAVVWQPTRRS